MNFSLWLLGITSKFPHISSKLTSCVACCDEIPGKRNWRKEGFILSHSLAGQRYLGGGLLMAANHPTSTICTQREVGLMLVPCVLLVQNPVQGMVQPTSVVGNSSLLTLTFWEHLCAQTQKYASMVILTTIKWWRFSSASTALGWTPCHSYMSELCTFSQNNHKIKQD